MKVKKAFLSFIWTIKFKKGFRKIYIDSRLPLLNCVQFDLLFYLLRFKVSPNCFCLLLIGRFFIYTYNIIWKINEARFEKTDCQTLIAETFLQLINKYKTLCFSNNANCLWNTYIVKSCIISLETIIKINRENVQFSSCYL